MSEPVIDLAARRTRSPMRHRVVITVLVLLAAVAVGWIVWFSSLLTADAVSVVGVEGGTAQQVRTTAAVTLGQPLAQVDTQAIQDRLTQLAWIDAIEVRRGWPHDVVIAVTPRTPQATTADGRVVDAEGVAFTPVVPVTGALPTVRGSGVGLVAAMGVLTSLPQDLRQKVVRLSASTRDDVELHLRSGATVIWGSVEQPELKAQVLSALLKRRAKVYDVSAPELPTTFKERV
ncbi:MAG: FtsQ-type POTRA domain-containing protein [Candidatus Nanopelagicales bacterium]|nr:FtsQ-type POTRA domain-containing protein [Candidatus Nanopelagicales bacterium]